MLVEILKVVCLHARIIQTETALHIVGCHILWVAGLPHICDVDMDSLAQGISLLVHLHTLIDSLTLFGSLRLLRLLGQLRGLVGVQLCICRLESLILFISFIGQLFNKVLKLLDFGVRLRLPNNLLHLLAQLEVLLKLFAQDIVCLDVLIMHGEQG